MTPVGFFLEGARTRFGDVRLIRGGRGVLFVFAVREDHEQEDETSDEAR